MLYSKYMLNLLVKIDIISCAECTD